MIHLEFLYGLFIGIFLGVTLFSRITKWFGVSSNKLNKSLLSEGKQEKTGKLIKDQSVDEDIDQDEDIDEDIDEDEISAVISKTRKEKSYKKETDIGILVDDLKQLSSGLMKSIPTSISENTENDLAKLISDLPRITEEIRNNPTMQNMYTIVDKMGKGDSFSEDDIRKMQEGMTDMVSSIFGGEITETETQQQKRDSEIILDMLNKIKDK